MKSTPEGHVLKSVMEYLAVKKIWCTRINTGALRTEGGGFMRFGVPGMADVLALVKIRANGAYWHVPLWLECKAAKGVQSPAQKAFQAEVEASGHAYLLARSIEDVEAWLSRNTCSSVR